MLLHGRGTSEQDVAPLIDVFDPRERLVGAFPRGPLQLPPIGHHWYATRRTGRRTPRPSSPPSSACGRGSSGLADRTGVPIERTVLGGFSQGAVMAWALGIGPGRPRPAGILAMSGVVPTVPGFVLQLEGLDGLPVAITHGTRTRSSPSSAARTRATALAGGADVVYRETEVPHIIDPRVVPGLVDWLDARF